MMKFSLLFIMKRGTGMCRFVNPHMPVFLFMRFNIFVTRTLETKDPSALTMKNINEIPYLKSFHDHGFPVCFVNDLYRVQLNKAKDKL